jgi:hypothetical protein
MGMLTGPLFVASGTSDIVNLDGHTFLDEAKDPDNAYAHIKCDNDGNMYSDKGTATPSWSQLDSVNDWVRPTGSAPGLYEVRYTSLTGDAVYAATTAEDVWHSLSGGDWTIEQRRTSIGTNDSIFLIQIRYNGGSVLASNTYELECDVISK